MLEGGGTRSATTRVTRTCCSGWVCRQPAHTIRALRELVDLYEAWGKSDKAVDYRIQSHADEAIRRADLLDKTGDYAQAQRLYRVADERFLIVFPPNRS